MESSHSYNVVNKKRFISIIGVVLISFGIIIVCSRSSLFEWILGSFLLLAENSGITKFWLKSPIEFPTNVYFFNWSNPHEFHNLSVKPKVTEVGPYSFMLSSIKENVVWNENNNTITYNNIRYWRIDDTKSNNMSDEITIFNCLTMYVSHYIKEWNYVIKRLVSSIIDEAAPNLHVTKTANEFALKGYSDIFVEIANYVPFIASEIPRFNEFGFLKIINGSSLFSGTLNMANGANGNFDVQEWNYQRVNNYFKPECAKVSGSAAEFYSRKKSKEHIQIFFPEVCRSLKFDFEKIVYIEGIMGYKYIIGKSVLDNGSLVPGNDCYCNGDCIPSGVLNISSCKYNLPAFASLPNFYEADPIYLNDIDGLHPHKDKHEMFVVLEPETFLLLQISLRIQFNVLVHPIDGISVYQNVRKVFFPIIWIEQNAILPTEYIQHIKTALIIPHIILSIGIILIILGTYLLYLANKPVSFYTFRIIKQKSYVEKT